MISSPDDHKQDKKKCFRFGYFCCVKDSHLKISNLRKKQKSILDTKNSDFILPIQIAKLI